MNTENKHILFGLLILSSLLLNSQTTTAQCHIDDWTALKALYESTDGDNWTNNTDWQQILGNAPASNCDLSLLYGVGLDGQGRVDSLYMFVVRKLKRNRNFEQKF